MDLNSNQLRFWPTLSAFVHIAFHHQLLGITEECPIRVKLKEVRCILSSFIPVNFGFQDNDAVWPMLPLPAL